MENHPIPQDVTGFQFKLIGNMTVKQFAFVAVGVILSVIIYYMRFFGIFRFLLLLIPSGLGIGLAFLPIEGRPMDVMLGNFLKALLAPNQYLFVKMGGRLAFAAATPRAVPVTTAQAQQAHDQTSAVKQQKLQAYLSHMQTTQKNDLDVKESKALASLSTIIGPTPPPSTLPPAVPPEATMPAQPGQTAQPTPTQHQEAPQSLTTPTQKTAAVDTEVANILSQKEQLKDEMAHMKQDLFAAHSQSAAPVMPQPPLSAAPQAPVVLPAASQAQGTTATTQPIPPTTTQSQLPQPAKTPFIAMTKPLAGSNRPAGIIQQAFTTPAAPNIIIGNVKDSRGNALANILVEIKDKESNPIRAFKTNVLGQFVSATPLQNGSYTIILEDPSSQHTFEPIPIEMSGTLIPTLEIVSFDAREALRRELFVR